MDANSFPDLLYELAINTTESKTFKSLEIPFANNYTLPWNVKESAIYGTVATDKLSLKKLEFEARFGLVNKIRGEPTEGIYGQLGVGRVGFSRNNQSATALRDSILAAIGTKVLCLSAETTDDGKLRSTLVSLGKVPFPSPDLILKTKSQDNVGDLWQLNVTSIQTGSYFSKIAIPAAFSTALNGIAGPERVVLPLVKALNAKYDKNRKEYIFPCLQEINPIFLGLNGAVVKLDRHSFSEPVNENDCQAKFSITSENRIILGSSIFLNRGFCFDFGYEEISVYKTKRNSHRIIQKNAAKDANSIVFVEKFKH
ncbi:unnamed protein product [Bursaphelenchus xylophilus]|nr:unnamed protein product [Bursaphelenchus xylophilus]CAG9100523.1 unnamed protein product [Bursaphelenchus xylophilus]